MKMRRARTILVLTLMFVVVAAASVSAQQDVKSLSGKWVGWLTPTRGGNLPVEVDVQPDGSYTSQVGSTIGKGKITMEGGKIMAEGQLVNGVGGEQAGVGKSQLTVTSKDGKQMISGDGRNDLGPFNYRLTKK